MQNTFYIVDPLQKIQGATGTCDLIYFYDSQISILYIFYIYLSVPSPCLQLSTQHVHSESSEQLKIEARLTIVPFKPAPILMPLPTPNLLLHVSCIRKGHYHLPKLRKLELWQSFLALPSPSHSTFSVSKCCFFHSHSPLQNVILKYLLPISATHYHPNLNHCHPTSGQGHSLP